jgi:hypothetical protein
MALSLKPRNPLEPVQELAGGSLADILTSLAEAVAEGQARLDLSSAEVAQQLAATKVKVVPAVRQIIGEKGEVKFEQADPIEVSLLELGLQPTFFSFSEASAEIAMDLQVVETVNETSTGPQRVLFGGTRSLRLERRLNRDLKVTSKISAKIVPVPAPPLLQPERSVEDRREDGGV